MDIAEQIKILEEAQALASIPKPRTVENFVNDMHDRGRSLTQTLIVAFSTRWKGQIKRIKETYHARASRENKKVSC